MIEDTKLQEFTPSEILPKPIEVTSKIEAVEASASKFLELHKKISTFALILSLLCTFMSPIMFRLAATFVDVSVPYLLYHNDPNNRHKIVESVYSSMEHWPPDAQAILVPLLDRVDEGKPVSSSFIAPLLAASYGLEVDTESVLNEWRIVDQSISLQKSFDTEYVGVLQTIGQEVEFLNHSTDQSIPFTDRLDLLPDFDEMKKILPHIDILSSDPEFNKLLFVKIHQQFYPLLSIEQLLIGYEESYFFYTEEPQPHYLIEVMNTVLIENKFLNSEFEFYWQLLEPHFDNKAEVFTIVYSKIHNRSPEDIAAIERYGITDPGMIAAITDKHSNIFQIIYSGLNDSGYVLSVYNLSTIQLTDALQSIQSFQSHGDTLSEREKNANEFLAQLYGQLLNKKPSNDISDSMNTNLSTYENENPELYEIVSKIDAEHRDKLFEVITSLTSGRTNDSVASISNRWNEAEAINYYQMVLKTFPNLPVELVIRATHYTTWLQIEAGTVNKNTIENNTIITMMALEDTFEIISQIENPFVQNLFFEEIINPLILHDVLLEPIALAEHVPGLNPIERQVDQTTFSGVYGEINLSTISLSRNIVTRENQLSPNQLAIVIPWSYAFSTTKDGGIINPAYQLNDTGKLETVSSATHEGDLNNPVNAALKMFAITKDGRIIQQPWSNFGENEEEIIGNLQSLGITTAFTPNYLFDSTEQEPLEEMGWLNDHINSFLIVMSDANGNQKLYAMILKGVYEDETKLLESVREFAPNDFKVDSIIWGDPGHAVYFGEESQDANGLVLGLTERETYRLFINIKQH